MHSTVAQTTRITLRNCYYFKEEWPGTFRNTNYNDHPQSKTKQQLMLCLHIKSSSSRVTSSWVLGNTNLIPDNKELVGIVSPSVVLRTICWFATHRLGVTDRLTIVNRRMYWIPRLDADETTIYWVERDFEDFFVPRWKFGRTPLVLMMGSRWNGRGEDDFARRQQRHCAKRMWI